MNYRVLEKKNVEILRIQIYKVTEIGLHLSSRLKITNFVEQYVIKEGRK